MSIFSDLVKLNHDNKCRQKNIATSQTIVLPGQVRTIVQTTVQTNLNSNQIEPNSDTV